MAVIDNLKVSKEALTTAINNYSTRKDALENTYLKISNEVLELDSTWHGEASEKFKSQFNQLYKNLEQNETVMDNVITKLKDALNLYEETEEEARSMAEGMDVGTAYQAHL